MTRTFVGRFTALALPLFAFSTSAFAQDPPPEAPEGEAPVEQAAPAGPVTYKVDSGRSVFIVRTYKGGVAAGMAHNHAIRATKTTGTVTWGEDGKTCKFDVTVDVNSFRVDDPGDRKIMGLEGEVSDDQRADIKANMLADDQLNGAKHPTMNFKADSCDGGTAKGTMTIVGNSASKSVPLKIEVKDGNLRAKGDLSFKHSDFGIEAYSAAFGAIRNEDRLTMSIDLQAVK